MAFRFRKSIKIFPGIKINFGKKSVGVSIGNKLGGVSINSKTGTTTRVSVPGTGISYTQKAKKTIPSKTANTVQQRDHSEYY